MLGQPGFASLQVLPETQRATDLWLNAVQNRSIKIEHGRFHGNLHLGGFDTGIISAKRQLIDR